MVVESHSAVRWATQKELLLSHCRKWCAHKNTQSQQPNVWFGNVPANELPGKSNFEAIGVKYLADPTKLKMTDDSAEMRVIDMDNSVKLWKDWYELIHPKAPEDEAIAYAVAKREKAIQFRIKRKKEVRQKAIRDLKRHPHLLKQMLDCLDKKISWKEFHEIEKNYWKNYYSTLVW